jgi:signal transduction histidine kinase/ActR/RegA family two-component response regulator
MLLTTLSALLVTLGAMMALDLRAYRQGWVDDLQSHAELLARTTSPALNFDDPRTAQENLAVLRLRPQIEAAVVYDVHGRPFASYSSDGHSRDMPRLPGADGVAADGRNLWIFKRIVEKGQILGTIYLRADYDPYGRLRDYGGVAAIVAALAMLFAWGLSSRLRQIVMRPIVALSDAAQHVVEQRDYSRRVASRGKDELGMLVTAHNAMMDEIQRRTEALEASNREKDAEVEERRRAQLEVMRLNDELEARVRDRTTQLERSNQDLVLATAAAEEANRAKSEFLSNMSHELRTPLNAIIGFGQLLSGPDAHPVQAAQGREFVAYIVNAGRHLLTLINDILNLAQIEAGKLTLSVEPVELDEVLMECRAMMAPLAEKRDVRMLFPTASRSTVDADRTRLSQVLLNLLSNAVKYNREHGTVVVDIARTAPDRVRVLVQDTGLGMQPEQLESLFQPFNRLGQETGKQEGTGIGLVLTRHLVELMGGNLGVSSAPGTGSVFWVELRAQPLVEGGTTVPTGPVDERKNGAVDVERGRETLVLYIEDNPASQQLVSSALARRPNTRLLLAANGKEGLELARATLPDVILMDNNMPVLSGTEAQAMLRADPRTAGIPIIALTANAMPAAIAKGLAAGFFSYLTKPVDIGELERTLENALRHVRRTNTAS